jgi:hypothetical protein
MATDTPTRFVETPEYRRHVYKWMRREVRRPHPGGRTHKWTATFAWRQSGLWVEAIR